MKKAGEGEPSNRPISLYLLGAGHEIRTHDFNLGKVALYH
jgi:hypothetical protein